MLFIADFDVDADLIQDLCYVKSFIYSKALREDTATICNNDFLFIVIAIYDLS